jgi:hypothetical protein
MFHVEIRSGLHQVRMFNLTEQRLWLEFLAPLMADNDFTVEDHDFSPRHTRLTVYEGPELRPDQLMGMGRGWQNVERNATDVTERVLERARQHTAQQGRDAAPDRQLPAPAGSSLPAAAGSSPPAEADLVRERLIGRIAAGPISAEEILGIVTELMPAGNEQQRLDVARHATWAVLERGGAQLTPSGR